MPFYQFLQSVMMLSPGCANCQSNPPGHTHDVLVESRPSVQRRNHKVRKYKRHEGISAFYRSLLSILQINSAVLTSSSVVVVFAATLLFGHTHSILQNHVTGTTTALAAPGGVQALCVTMEIWTGARTRLPARPVLLASATVFRRKCSLRRMNTRSKGFV